MKPLTIEQLKALEIGDWVWVVCCIAGTYAMKINQSEKCLEYQTIAEISYLDYSDYGKTWLAYKNKEQAEAEGEIVELPCKVGDTIYYLTREEHMRVIPFTVTAMRFVYDDGHFDWYLIDKTGCGVWWKHCYVNKAEAERRFAELKGEK